MVSLPPFETPLNQHSLMALESWLSQLGAERSQQDPCRWNWAMPQWTAEIKMEQDELKVTWDQEGQRSQCCFPYGLTRRDVEEVIKQGP